MDELKDQFIQRSIAALRVLSDAGHDKLRAAETFRQLHTIKGTAQTFGLTKAAKLAHEVESMLSGSTDKSFIAAGFQHLVTLLENEDCTENFNITAHRSTGASGKIFISALSCEIFRRLADNEKTRLFAAHNEGLELFRLDRFFPMVEFTPAFKALKEKLDQAGEVIATLPGEPTPGSLAFKFYIAAKNSREIEDLADDTDASLASLRIPAGPLARTIEQLAAYAVDLARCSEKKVNFICCVEGNTPSDKTVKMVFDMLLHLVRNAIDHAFSSKGNIFVSLSIEDKGTHVAIEDDGAGIDPEKIREKAAQRGLTGNEVTDEEAIALIFSPGFSTADAITETSGRGVGLDAVKNIIENAGGTIDVKSTPAGGTKFKIFLPGIS